MGVSIHYRGRLADPLQLEALEDFVIDLVLELGGQVDVWRSAADHDPQRMVRGVTVNMAPGQETTSLVFSPEGWLTPLFSVEEAERGELEEGAWCSVKTQYGSPVGHAALVEVLAVVRRFVPDLEVEDETGYWRHRDPKKLADSFDRTARAISALSTALEGSPLSEEAREDPEIVAARVERVAKVVHAALRREGNPPASGAGSGTDSEAVKSWPEVESEWQALVRENEARARRMQRRIEERLLAGDTPERAVDAARAQELPKPEPPNEEEGAAWESDDLFEPDAPPDESWLEAPDDVSIDREDRRDPLLERATELYLELIRLAEPDGAAIPDDLLRHAGELCGGLAQALPLPSPYDFDEEERGLTAAQLKRALRGAAFLRGGLVNLAHASPSGGAFDALVGEVDEVQGEVVDRLKQTRPAPEN